MRWSAALLRFVQGAIGFLYLIAASTGAVLTTVGRPGPPAAGEVAAGVVAVGAVLLVMPEILIGAVIGALTFDEPDSRRAIRRVLAPYLVLAVVGVGALLGSIALGVPAWDAVATLVVGLALLPAFVALGRAARSRDVVLRADDPAGRAWLVLRRGYRASAIGAVVGLVVALTSILVIVGLVAGLRGDVLHFAPVVLGFACVGATFGALPAQLRISRIVREVVGPEFGQVRRIARVVIRGKRDVLSDADQETAAEYARVIEPFLRAQALLLGCVWAGLVLNLVGQVLNARVGDPVFRVLLPVYLVLAVVLAVYMAVRIRRVRAYAAVHPVAA